ncbi:MAG: hypothetical protein M1821_001997 [Bathelium mastoideum]|nr:MAG: hypothetical protein M1821_001997 [Bathelium mastoideum]
MERLETFVSRVQDSLLTAERASAESTSGRASKEVVGQDMATQMGKLRLCESGSTQWVGPYHWESIIDDVEESSVSWNIADVKAFFELDKDADSPKCELNGHLQDWNIPDVDIFMGVPQIFSTQVLQNLLPPKAEMDRFVAAWFNVNDPTRVVVHAPTFQQQYREFWLNPYDIQPAWLALLLVSSAVGAEISSQISNDASIQARADQLNRLAVHCLVRADVAKPQPHLIEALILYATSLLFKHHDATPWICQVCGLIVRLCYQAGYHRDPSGNPKFSAFECEMRRRIWMVARELEISVSCCFGTVSSVISSLCDAAPPANLLDTDFSSQHCSPPRPHEECTLVQIQICYTRIISLLGDTVVSSHSVTPPSKAEIHALSERLKEARNELPQKLKIIPLDQCLIDSPTEVIDRLRLELAYQKALCILYHRFLGNPHFEDEHHQCVLAALAIVKYSIAILEATEPGGKLASLKIMLVRHIHDFNLAAMILCAEIKRAEALGTMMAPRCVMDANVRSLLLQACHLWNVPNLPSSKAQVALDAMIAFLNAGSHQNTWSEKCLAEMGVPVEEPLAGNGFTARFSAGSFGLYDSATLLGIAAGSLPEARYERSDSLFSGLFEQTHASISEGTTAVYR